MALADKPLPIGILIVDDHRIVRDGLMLIIGQEPDMRVVGTATSGEQALERVGETRPDVIIMDLQLPGMSGVATIATMRANQLAMPIVVLTMYDGDEDIRQAMDAGATTYVLKHSISNDLVEAIRAVHAGQRPISHDVQARLADRQNQPALTAREREVLELVLDGQSEKEIAVTLAISYQTVRAHMKNIYLKLDVHDRTEAIKTALRRGILHIR